MPARKKAGEIWWFEPRWSVLPKVVEATAFFRKWRFWIFFVVLPYAGFVALTLGLARILPEVREAALPIFLKGAGTLIFFLGFLRYGFILIPPLVTVSRRGIMTGRVWVRPDCIKHVQIDARRAGQPLLIVEWTVPDAADGRSLVSSKIQAKRHVNPSTVGIGAKISIDQLGDLVRELFPQVSFERLS